MFTVLVAGYLEIKLKKEPVASNECVYRENIPLCGYPPILVSDFYHGLPDISTTV